MPIWFVPRERQYKGERCGGVQILITDWKIFDPLKLGLVLALTLRKHYPLEWKPEGILPLLGDRASYQAILAGREVAEIEGLWQSELAAFLAIRARYLLYGRGAELSPDLEIGLAGQSGFRGPGASGGGSVCGSLDW